MPSRRAIPAFFFDEYTTSPVRDFSIERLESSFMQRPHRAQPHYHPFFQVFLTFGTGTLMHDFVTYPFTTPTLTFMTPGQVHFMPPASTISGLLASFTQSFFDDVTPPPSRLLSYPFFYNPQIPPFLPLKAADAERFRHLFEAMETEFQNTAEGTADILRAYLQIIFTLATRLHRKHYPAATPSSRPSQLVHAFRLTLEQHFHEWDHLADYASALQITPNHLNDTVKGETGQAAGELLRERRLLEAKRLLLHSSLSVSEIGYTLNFKDPSYFGRFFRRYTGASPAAFRAETREKYQRMTS